MMGLPTSAKAEKIIVMCDCKVSLDDLYQFGESVEEWKIDAPTVAFKAGDVQAYRRVCLDIKKEVDELTAKLNSLKVYLNEESTARCYTCQGTDHLSYQCTKKICRYCKEEGHYKDTCPKLAGKARGTA